AEALADGAVEDAAGAGRVLENQARRLERLVADLLDLAHLRAGRFSLERAPVDLTAVALDVGGAARPAAVAAGVEVGHPASPDGAPVVALADGGRVAQVLADLLDNAIRHAASTVSLTVEDGRGACRLVIDDDGPGIPAEERDLVFERFWSGGGRNDRTATSGLGLTIAAELCSAMGGRATVADSPLGGARFVIELPSGASLVATSGGALDPA
nr:HAMP domain-containing histidine kinase [Acidimicrobiia bacterium]